MRLSLVDSCTGSLCINSSPNIVVSTSSLQNFSLIFIQYVYHLKEINNIVHKTHIQSTQSYFSYHSHTHQSARLCYTQYMHIIYTPYTHIAMWSNILGLAIPRITHYKQWHSYCGIACIALQLFSHRCMMAPVRSNILLILYVLWKRFPFW